MIFPRRLYNEILEAYIFVLEAYILNSQPFPGSLYMEFWTLT